MLGHEINVVYDTALEECAVGYCAGGVWCTILHWGTGVRYCSGGLWCTMLLWGCCGVRYYRIPNILIHSLFHQTNNYNATSHALEIRCPYRLLCVNHDVNCSNIVLRKFYNYFWFSYFVYSLSMFIWCQVMMGLWIASR